MNRVRPVLVTFLLAAALLVPTVPAHADEGETPTPVGPVLRHGDLIGAVVTRTLTTTQGGDSITQVVTDHYDTRGRLVLQDVVGTDASGSVVLREQSTSEYDAKGQLVHEATVSDYDGDGAGAPITNAVDTTFDAAGFVVRKVATVDYESDGVPEQRQVVSFDNDRKGRAVSTKVTNDFDGDGVDDVEISSMVVYDAKGNVLRSTSIYSNQDGVSSIEEQAVTYNGHGQPVTSTSSTYGRDGGLQTRSVMSETYDRRGNVLESTVAYDFDGDGALDDGRNVDTFEYDAKGRLVLLSVRTVPDDGPLLPTSYTERFSYDDQGWLVLDETVSDWDGDGRTDSTTRRVVTYDHQGRRLSEVSSYDYDGDGSADGSYREELGYDNRGRLLTDVLSGYSNGVLINRESKSYAYPSRTDYTLTTETDYDGDGVVDVTTVATRQVD
jgi:hypothetical protein